MRASTFVTALIGVAAAQRPASTSICDYYTTALLKDNTAANQALVLTLLVNTVVIGNYTKPKIPGITFPDVVVPGILANGTYQGTEVSLLPYFDGGLAIANRGGSAGVSVNFLDDGGAAPLLKNLPSNGNVNSNQYLLLTHLYQYFGVLLGCSQQGSTGFSAYQGKGSQYSVHKFMNLDSAQVGYFITQVGLAAKSFGVADADITIVATALESIFDVRCGPPTTVVKAQGPQLQSICIAPDCKLSPNATCSAYESGAPAPVSNSTTSIGSGSASSSSPAGTATGSSATGSPATGPPAAGSSTAASGTGAPASSPSIKASSDAVASFGVELFAVLGFSALAFML